MYLEQEYNCDISVFKTRTRLLTVQPRPFVDSRALFQLLHSNALDDSRLGYPFRIGLSVSGQGHQGWMGMASGVDGLYSSARICIGLAEADSIVEKFIEEDKDLSLQIKNSPGFKQMNKNSLIANYVFYHEWRHVIRTLKGMPISAELADCHKTCTLEECQTDCRHYVGMEIDCNDFASDQLQKIATGQSRRIIHLPNGPVCNL